MSLYELADAGIFGYACMVLCIDVSEIPRAWRWVLDTSWVFSLWGEGGIGAYTCGDVGFVGRATEQGLR